MRNVRKSSRIAGFDDNKRLVHALNEYIAMNDADPLRPNVVTIPQIVTATQVRRDYLLSRLRLGNTEIVRISTPIGVFFSKRDMETLMSLFIDSSVWGVNMGEFHASEAAWCFFGQNIFRTSIGFVWINERGKDIGASVDVHEWLLGLGAYASCGILRGKSSPLALNRKKEVRGKRPWFDSGNPTLHDALAKKFLFNPHNSICFA